MLTSIGLPSLPESVHAAVACAKIASAYTKEVELKGWRDEKETQPRNTTAEKKASRAQTIMTRDANDNDNDPSPTSERTLSESSTLHQSWSPKQPAKDRPEPFSIPIDGRDEKKEFEKPICLDDHNRAVHGYPKLATFMAHEPGGAIARRFASLNLRILLYKQAEIVCLEHELDEMEVKFGHKKDLHHSVKALIHAKSGSEGKELWDKIQTIDVALERYSKDDRDPCHVGILLIHIQIGFFSSKRPSMNCRVPTILISTT